MLIHSETQLTFSFLFSDTMDKWDQNKLEEVIEKKHGEKEKTTPKTEIVSCNVQWWIKQ